MLPIQFLDFCDRNKITIEECQGTMLTLCKRFTPGSASEYASAESDVSVIYSAKSVGAGSVWGTDGGSIGGMVGMQGGYMRLHKSNVSKRWNAELRKLMAAYDRLDAQNKADMAHLNGL